MLAALLVTGVLWTVPQGVRPPDYTERSLCDLWAGAQCQQARCGDNSKERCLMESKRCRNTGRVFVPRDRASRMAQCAKAMLRKKCGEELSRALNGRDVRNQVWETVSHWLWYGLVDEAIATLQGIDPARIKNPAALAALIESLEPAFHKRGNTRQADNPHQH